MSDFDPLWFEMGRVLTQAIRNEWINQGHYLTGTLSESLQVEIKGLGEDGMEMYAAAYAQQLEDGIKPESITWAMLPNMIKYFLQRGFGSRDAQRFAELTIARWMKHGMPTEGALAYSRTGKRTGAMADAIEKVDARLDAMHTAYLDKLIDEKFNRLFTSETI